MARRPKESKISDALLNLAAARAAAAPCKLDNPSCVDRRGLADQRCTVRHQSVEPAQRNGPFSLCGGPVLVGAGRWWSSSWWVWQCRLEWASSGPSALCPLPSTLRATRQHLGGGWVGQDSWCARAVLHEGGGPSQ